MSLRNIGCRFKPSRRLPSCITAVAQSRLVNPTNSKLISSKEAIAHRLNAGWVGPEPWGQWTGAAQAALSFTVWPPRDRGFALLVRGLESAKAPKQSIWLEANHCRIGDLEFDLAHRSESQIISGAIPAKCIDGDGKIVLRINTDRMRGPRALGINDDARSLGVGIGYLIIRGVNSPNTGVTRELL